MPVTSCPSFERLSQFRLGLLAESRVSEMEAHLRECESCLKRLPPSQGDPLIRGLRSQHKRPPLNNPVMEQLRQEMRTSFLPQPPNEESPTLGDAPSAEMPTLPHIEPKGGDVESEYDFLAPPQAPGELGRLGNYRVLKVLGEGGMGLVLHAEDIQLGRSVALKVMKPAIAAEASARKRFKREARAQAALEHDHIVTIHHIDEVDGTPFLAMPLLQGETLGDRLQREEVLPLDEVLRIGRQTAEALAAAHDKGLIHRDIKPANLWLEAPSGRVKVLDFGLAAMPCPEGEKTLPGTILGTPGYMAPEQNESEADTRSDLFSLGCVLYRMATGKPPFDGETPLQKIRSVLIKTPEPPQKYNPSLPLPLCNLILRLLAKNPEDRPATATAVARVLETLAKPSSQAIHAPVAQIAKTPTLPAPIPSSSPTLPVQHEQPNRWMLYWAIGSASAVLLAGLVMLLVWWGGRTDETPDGSPDKIASSGKSSRTFVVDPVRKTNATPFDVSKAKSGANGRDPIFNENWVIDPVDGKEWKPFQALKCWTVQPKNLGSYYPSSFDITKDEHLLIRFQGAQGAAPIWKKFIPQTNGVEPAPFDGTYTELSHGGEMCVRTTNEGVQIWTQSARGKDLKTTIFKLGSYYNTTISPDEKRIAVNVSNSGGWGNPLVITEDDGDELGEFYSADQPSWLSEIAWSPDSSTLAVLCISEGKRAVAFIRSPWKKVTIMPLPDLNPYTSLVWSPNSAYLAVGYTDKSLCIVDVDKQQVAVRIQDYQVVTPPAWSPDGTELAFGTEDRKVIVRNLSREKTTFTFLGHTRPVTCLAFLGDGRTLVSGSRESCRFWDLEENTYRGALLLDATANYWLAIGPRGHVAHGNRGDSTFVYRCRDLHDDRYDLTPIEFYERFSWKADPSKIKLTDLKP